MKYSFIDNETKEEFELDMSLSEREEFIKNNPNLTQIIKQVNIGDPIRMGVTKPPSDFSKYVLGKVAQVPGADKSTLERRHNIVKEI